MTSLTKYRIHNLLADRGGFRYLMFAIACFFLAAFLYSHPENRLSVFPIPTVLLCAGSVFIGEIIGEFFKQRIDIKSAKPTYHQYGGWDLKGLQSEIAMFLIAEGTFPTNYYPPEVVKRLKDKALIETVPTERGKLAGLLYLSQQQKEEKEEDECL